MVNSPMAVFSFMAFGIAIALLSAAAGPAAAQNCGCQAGYSCSKYGYCGTTSAFCGSGCQAGPCIGGGGGGGGGGVSLESIITESFFNGIKSKSGNWCPGKSFYTRQVFLTAALAYPGFGKYGTTDDSIREIAAFFAHVTHETGFFCYIEEVDGASSNYCDPSSRWPCSPGQGYYGRGPLQISWNYNYGPAGRDIGFDGLRNPGIVAQDPLVSFKSALWYWMTYVHRVLPQGFGATTRAINGYLECDGRNVAEVIARIGYYKAYCRQFGVDPGTHLTC